MSAIAAERALKGWSQTDLAREMHKDRSTISRWERDPESIGITNLCALASLFGVSTDYILGRSPERVPHSTVNA